MNKLCIDIGGTNTRVALLSGFNKIIKVEKFSTIKNSPKENFLKIIDISKDWNYSSINIATAGPIDIETGIYAKLPNLPSFEGFDIKNFFLKYTDVSCYIENDARCSTLCEAKYREEETNFAFLTISTGFGGGYLLNNKLLSGNNDLALSVYNYKVDDEYTLEKLCSGTGILNYFKKGGFKFETTKEIFEAYENNEEVQKYLNYIADKTSDFLNNFVILFNPKYIVLGGSVVSNNKFYFDILKSRVNDTLLEQATDPEYNTLNGAYLLN